jgi:hypothetical protein
MKIKLKITKPNKEGWWYNSHIGEEFEITKFQYYYDGSNYPLKIETLEEFYDAINKYGDNFHVSTSREKPILPEGIMFTNGWMNDGWGINLKDTNYKELFDKVYE